MKGARTFLRPLVLAINNKNLFFDTDRVIEYKIESKIISTRSAFKAGVVLLALK